MSFRGNSLSYRGEVIADNTGQWCGNGLRFETPEEAQTYIADLARRWTLVRQTRVVDCELPANYRMVGQQLTAIESVTA